MKRRASWRWRAHISGALAVLMCVACAKPDTAASGPQGDVAASVAAGARAGEDPIDPVTGVEVSCGYVKRLINPSASALLAEHLKRDAAGTLMESDPWIAQSDDCPGHLPGSDAYTLIASYHQSAVSQRRDTATAVVTFQRLGRVWPSDSTFEVDTATIAHPVQLVRTRYGWRITHETYPWLNVALASAKHMQAHDRVVAARLARTMAREAATAATASRRSPP